MGEKGRKKFKLCFGVLGVTFSGAWGLGIFLSRQITKYKASTMQELKAHSRCEWDEASDWMKNKMNRFKNGKFMKRQYYIRLHDRPLSAGCPYLRYRPVLQVDLTFVTSLYQQVDQLDQNVQDPMFKFKKVLCRFQRCSLFMSIILNSYNVYVQYTITLMTADQCNFK